MQSEAPAASSEFGPLIGHDLSRQFGIRTVFDGIDISAHPGQRVGIVGENGAGKSTLLRILAGVDAPDRGSVERPTRISPISRRTLLSMRRRRSVMCSAMP